MHLSESPVWSVKPLSESPCVPAVISVYSHWLLHDNNLIWLTLAAVSPVHNVTYCEGDYASISCDPGFNLVFVDAFYGRLNKETCPHESAILDLNCSQATILQTLQTGCGHSEKCYFNVNGFNLGDPCPGTYKYLHTRFKCNSKFTSALWIIMSSFRYKNL